jgi:hypothetical protein
MTLLTAPKLYPTTADEIAEPINLYKLGMLFVVKCSYWSCRAGNEAEELDLTPDRIDAKAIASFGTKDLLDPTKTRKVFQQIEKKARHVLEKHSRPFAAANAHFVPWPHVQTVIEQLETLTAEFDQAVNTFLAEYATLRAQWQAQHADIPNASYPSPMALPAKFTLSWHAFKVTGAPQLTPVEDIEMELDQRRVRDEQVKMMEDSVRLPPGESNVELWPLFHKLLDEAADIVTDGARVDAVIVMDVLKGEHSEEVSHAAEWILVERNAPNLVVSSVGERKLDTVVEYVKPQHGVGATVSPKDMAQVRATFAFALGLALEPIELGHAAGDA